MRELLHASSGEFSFVLNSRYNNMSTKRIKKFKWKKWLKNALLYSSPSLLALLTALQSGASLEFAMGAFYSALLGTLIDGIKKFREAGK